MRAIKYLLAVPVLLLLTLPVTAQDRDGTLEGTAQITAYNVDVQEEDSAKFYEYRDVPNGLVFHLFDLKLDAEKYFVGVKARNAGRSDERYDITYGEYGRFKLSYRYDRIPHNFSFHAVTPYTETSPGVWTLPDDLQGQLEGIVGDTGTNLPEAMDILSDYLANAHDASLKLHRKRQEVDFDYAFSSPLRLKVNLQDELKKGYRAIGTALGFGNVMELPETVDQRTQQGEISLGYFKKNVSIDFGIVPSRFENDITDLTWDNPYRLTDQTSPGDLTFLVGNGSAMGQMALAPDNTATRIFFNGTFKLLKSTRLHLSLSYNHLSQDDTLLPFTDNTGLTADYSDALSAPRATSDLQADDLNARLALRTRLTSRLYLNVGYAYHDYDSSGGALTLPGYAILDQNWVDEPQEVQFYDYNRESYYANLSFLAWQGTSFEIGYRGQEMERELGDISAGKNDEDTFYLTAMTEVSDWLTFRGTYAVSDRDWSLENGGNVVYPVRNDATLAFRRYFEAQRDREELKLDLSLNPIENLGISLLYRTALNDYDESEYGLKNDDYRSFSCDVNYAIGRHTLYGFYVWEENKGLQVDRETTFPPFDVISNDPLNDWTARLTDTTDTYGFGGDFIIKPDKLVLKISYTYSTTDGDSFLGSPAGGRPDLAVNFNDELDSVDYTIAKARLTYTVNDHLKIGLSEWYEKYDMSDIMQEGVNVDMLREGYAFYLGAMEPDYEYFVSAVHLVYTW